MRRAFVSALPAPLTFRSSYTILLAQLRLPMPPDSATRLPVVRFRCDQRFDDFAATDTPGVGFCSQCRRSVHDFRGRSAAHIRAVHRAEIAAGRGMPCGAYDRLFVETPLPPEPGPWRVRWTGWLAALGLGAPLGLAGCATERTATRSIPFVSAVEPLSGGSRCDTEHVRLVGTTSTDTLRGVVVDEQGLEVIGATVTIVGTPLQAVTDLEGRFAIVQPNNPYRSDVLRVGVEALTYRVLLVDHARWGQELRLVLHQAGEVTGIVVFTDDGVKEEMESRGGVTTVLHRGLETIRRVVYPHR